MEVYYQIVKDRKTPERPRSYSQIHRFYFPDRFLISVGEDSGGLYQEHLNMKDSPELRRFSKQLKTPSGRKAIGDAITKDDLNVIQVSSKRVRTFERRANIPEQFDSSFLNLSNYLMTRAVDIHIG